MSMQALQSLLVAVLVAGCLVYAGWSLAPRSLRRWLGQKLLPWPLPAWLKRPLLAATRMQGGCGCDGCDAPLASEQSGQGAPVKTVHVLRGNYRRKPPA